MGALDLSGPHEFWERFPREEAEFRKYVEAPGIMVSLMLPPVTDDRKTARFGGGNISVMQLIPVYWYLVDTRNWNEPVNREEILEGIWSGRGAKGGASRAGNFAPLPPPPAGYYWADVTGGLYIGWHTIRLWHNELGYLLYQE